MRRGIILAVLATLAVLGSPAGGAVAAGPGLPVSAVAAGPASAVRGDALLAVARETCDIASQFVEDARPQAALVFIGGVRASQAWPCLDGVGKVAEAAVAEAQATAERADELIQSNPESARDAANNALATDRDNQLASEVLEAVDPPTATQRAHVRWNGFLESTLVPLGDLAVPVAAVPLGVLVLARLVTLLKIRWPRSSGRRRTLASIGAVLLALAGGVWLATGLSVPAVASGSAAYSGMVLAMPGGGLWLAAGVGAHPGAITAWPPPPVVLLVVGLGVAVLLAAYALATRLRVSVAVRNSEGDVDEAGTGHVVALLADLGGAGPRGLEAPRGTDVSVLDESAISGLSKYPVVGLLTTALQTALGLTPWRVRVDVESPHRHSVTVSRNGRMVAAGGVDRDRLGLRTPRTAVGAAKVTDTDEENLPDLHPFAAAMTLVAMADEYVGSDFVGLFGVRNWRSVALSDIATGFYAADDDTATRITLLNRALTFDQSNLPAAVALQHARHRHETDLEAMRGYQATLKMFLKRLDSDGRVGQDRMAMRARVLLTYLVMSANVCAKSASVCAADQAHYQESARRLVDLLLTADARGPSAQFIEDMTPNAASMFLHFLPTSPVDGADGADEGRRKWAGQQVEDTSCFSARALYNDTCRAVAKDPPDPGEAWLPLLKAALDDPTHKKWATQDPALQRLSEVPTFRALVMPPKQGLLDVSPFTEKAELLRDAGLGSPRALTTVRRGALARQLAVDRLVARRLHELAGLWLQIEESASLKEELDITGLHGQVFTALLSDGIESARDLRAREGDPDFRHRIVASVQQACGANVQVKPHI